MIQWIFLISVVYVLAHHSTISKKKKSKKEKESIPWVKRIPKWTPALIITQLGSIIYFVIISTTDGEAWFDTTIRRHPNAHYKSLPQAQQLTNDVDTAIVAAILGGTVCSLTRQRWAISKMSITVQRVWAASILLCTSIPVIINTANETRPDIGVFFFIIYGLCFLTSMFLICVSICELREVPQVSRKESVNELPLLPLQK
jgi:hypothetical protein